MAETADIQEVRTNTNESDTNTSSFEDEVISLLVDNLGISGASATIWGQKAAKYAEQVTVSEAGASRQLSDLSKNALAMQKLFQTAYDKELAIAGARRTVVSKIVRS